ncbi:MAG: GGDEF domain-containing protein [Spirochaetaceae bacterium]
MAGGTDAARAAGKIDAEEFSRKLTALHAVSLELSTADSVDELCRRAVELGRSRLGFPRLGIWFFDREDPDWMVGTYGIDESGRVRSEHGSRISVDPGIIPPPFLDGTTPYLLFPAHDIYNHRRKVVGQADLAVAPIWNSRVSMGIVSADNLTSDVPLDEMMCQVLALLARSIGHLATLKETEAELRESRERLEVLASRDGLTGLLNRRTGLEMLDHQLSRSRRENVALAVCFMDLDRLKQINDSLGHEAGDRYILAVVSVLETSVRESDVLCRIGGDEFMIILPASTTAQAEAVLERIVEGTEASEALRALKPPPYLSYGIVEYSGSERSADELIRRADELMYERKRRHHLSDGSSVQPV